MAGLCQRAICSYDGEGRMAILCGRVICSYDGRERWQACVGELSVVMMGLEDGRPVS